MGNPCRGGSSPIGRRYFLSYNEATDHSFSFVSCSSSRYDSPDHLDPSEVPMLAAKPDHNAATMWVLGHWTAKVRDLYTLGRKLGQGQFGTTHLCKEIATGQAYACKSISKRKLIAQEDVEEVRREIQIMLHLAGHRNVVTIKGEFEDALYLHIVMELCEGGELFDRIIQQGHYSEHKAAELTQIIVGVVEACHSLGVMHRDLKPENFLLANVGRMFLFSIHN